MRRPARIFRKTSSNRSPFSVKPLPHRAEPVNREKRKANQKSAMHVHPHQHQQRQRHSGQLPWESGEEESERESALFSDDSRIQNHTTVNSQLTTCGRARK